MSDALLEAALTYAKLGLAIFPTAGKIPRTPRGFLDATVDEAQVREWWGQWPDAGIGLPTGARNGLVVVDVDDAEAFEAFQRDHGRLPETEEAITPSGGRHLYFRHPRNGALVRSAAGLRGYVGVDVRADGGYVVAPPTPGYAWEILEHDRADLPSVFLEPAAPRGEPAGEHTEESAPILKGARNAALASLGGSMRSRGMTEAAIRAALLEENAARCHPPLPDDEVAAIAKSVSRYEPEAGPRLRRGERRLAPKSIDSGRMARAPRTRAAPCAGSRPPSSPSTRGRRRSWTADGAMLRSRRLTW